jgi:hypothetical protein
LNTILEPPEKLLEVMAVDHLQQLAKSCTLIGAELFLVYKHDV